MIISTNTSTIEVPTRERFIEKSKKYFSHYTVKNVFVKIFCFYLKFRGISVWCQRIMKYTTFFFESFSFDTQTLEATFVYHFDETLFFTEKIYFRDTRFPLREYLDTNIIENFLFPLHIALGISYYKFFPTETLVVRSGKLDTFQTDFWEKFYRNGLGEFLFQNHIDPTHLFQFSSQSKKIYQKKEFSTQGKYLVPVWGGKDSIVTIELLKKWNFDFDLFTFATKDHILYESTQHISGKNRLFIRRELSRNIPEILKNGAQNGHVPISGMMAFVLQMCAYIYDYQYIVMSNEYSANFGNTQYFGQEINHQRSKSFEFENHFRQYTRKYLSSGIEYFSLLRGWYEGKITQVFSQIGKQYFGKFSSCNTNFTILSQKKDWHLWCGKCPKCAFVYAILRPYLTDEETLQIFGKELYEDTSLESLFCELLWISGHKPFECVWESEEVVLGVYQSMKLVEKWKKNPPFLFAILQKELQWISGEKIIPNIHKKIHSFHSDWNLIPHHLLPIILAYES